jgi:multiple sugar transport system permease protein
MHRSRLGVITTYGVLFGSVLVALFPIFWTVSTSLKTRVDTLSFPPKIVTFSPIIGNFSAIINDPDFLRALKASVLVTTLSTVLCVACAILAAYGLARHPRFVTRRPLEATLILVRALPGMVLAVPVYAIAVKLGLYDNWIAVSVVLAGLNLPIAVWLLVSFIRGVPYELEEGAHIDGANQVRVLTQIVLPIALPGIAATMIFVSLLSWNEFLIPLVLGEQSAKTLPVYVGGFVTSRTIDWGPLAAASAVAIVPIAALTIFVQRWLVRGLSLGAVKE